MTRVSAILTFLAAASTTLAAAISPDVLFRRDDTIWCGAIQSKVPSGHFTDVYGEWVIPKLSKRNGQAGSTPNNELNVPMWVGIDGVGGICNNGALLQAGTTTFLHPDGKESTQFWVEFFPKPAEFQNFEVNTGDHVSVQIHADSMTKGTVHLHNLTKNKTKTITVSAPSGKSLCGKSLEWIIEWSGRGIPHFDGFNSKASGKTSTGKSVDAKGAQPADVHRGGKTYCKGSVTNAGDVHFASN